MAKRTFVSFDWAIKRILRDKENFPEFKAKGMERFAVHKRCFY